MDVNVFKAIMTSEIVPSESKMVTISILQEYTNPTLKSNDKGEVWMEASLTDVMQSDISQEDVETLHKGGWFIDNNVLKLFF
jgi:hypothetical protein